MHSVEKNTIQYEKHLILICKFIHIFKKDKTTFTVFKKNIKSNREKLRLFILLLNIYDCTVILNKPLL